jgi:hypothetical protein
MSQEQNLYARYRHYITAHYGKYVFNILLIAHGAGDNGDTPHNTRILLDLIRIHLTEYDSARNLTCEAAIPQSNMFQ